MWLRQKPKPNKAFCQKPNDYPNSPFCQKPKLNHSFSQKPKPTKPASSPSRRGGSRFWRTQPDKAEMHWTRYPDMNWAREHRKSKQPHLQASTFKEHRQMQTTPTCARKPLTVDEQPDTWHVAPFPFPFYSVLSRHVHTRTPLHSCCC